ncbi:MAG: hypothetical protein IT370_06865 [Deltaproteobacteria bacterium]|nr:hypothetical protein [Deltaproteobacteria bacterium]
MTKPRDEHEHEHEHEQEHEHEHESATVALLARASAARAVAPAPGFESRVQTAAAARLGRPARGRWLTRGLAGAAVAAVVLALLVGRWWGQRVTRRAPQPVALRGATGPQPGASPLVLSAEEEAALWQELPVLLDARFALAYQADWSRYQARLEPYRVLVEETP